MRVLDDTSRSGVTPRLAVLPGDELALVYVSVDGDPPRVSMERFSADLERIAGPTVIAGDAWSWAEPAWVGDTLAVAYGRTVADPSELAVGTGAVTGSRGSTTAAFSSATRAKARRA